MRFDPVAPNDIGRWWPFVLKGIEQIRRECNEPLPEYVYHRILIGHATLFIVMDKEPLGFVVLEKCEFSPGIPYLNIWLMHFVSGGEFRKEVTEWADEMAKKVGGVVRFTSPRKGWIKFLEDEFKVVGYIFERKVP